MSGLEAYVESMTKIHTTAAEKPDTCAVNGLNVKSCFRRISEN